MWSSQWGNGTSDHSKWRLIHCHTATLRQFKKKRGATTTQCERIKFTEKIQYMSGKGMNRYLRGSKKQTSESIENTLSTIPWFGHRDEVMELVSTPYKSRLASARIALRWPPHSWGPCSAFCTTRALVDSKYITEHMHWTLHKYITVLSVFTAPKSQNLNIRHYHWKDPTILPSYTTRREFQQYWSHF